MEIITYILKVDRSASISSLSKGNDTDYWQNDKCVGQGCRKCEGDEYDGY